MNYTACLVLIGVAERARSKCHTTRVSAAADWQFAHSTRGSARPASQTHFFARLCRLSTSAAQTNQQQRKPLSLSALKWPIRIFYTLAAGIVSLSFEWKKWHAARCCMMICRSDGEQRFNSLRPFLIFLSPSKCNHWAPTLAFITRQQYANVIKCIHFKE